MSSRAVCCKHRLKLELDENSSALIRLHLRLIFYQFKAQDSIIPPPRLTFDKLFDKFCTWKRMLARCYENSQKSAARHSQVRT